MSYDLIYGYEMLSKIASRHNAYAAVNGGFFRDFGLPSGMVVIDGHLISAATGDYPVLILRSGQAELKEIESKLYIVINGGEGDAVSSGNSGGSGAVAGSSGSTVGGSGETAGAVGESGNIAGGSAVMSDTEKTRLEIDNINFPASGKQTIVYTYVRPKQPG